MTAHRVSSMSESTPHDHAWRPVRGAAQLADQSYGEYWCPLCGLVWPAEERLVRAWAE